MAIYGLITSSHGRHYTVEVDGRSYHTISRGKKSVYVVGDRVVLNIINQEQAQISELIPRESLIYRSDLNRSKLIASNVTQILIVCAVKPNFNRGFLDSCLINAEASQIQAVIIINKSDLSETAPFTAEIKALYGDGLGYSIMEVSAHADCSSLTQILDGQCSLLIGQSGMGKSTLMNCLSPQAQAKTGAICKSETSGSHTTTNASLYHLNPSTSLIDCPGLQEFGLMHLELSELSNYFPEMRPLLGQCRFANCQHLSEPGCMITSAVTGGVIHQERYTTYQRICNTLKQKRNY